MISFRHKRISLCREIAATPETVWAVVTDTQLWALWGPSVLEVDCSDRYIEAGSTGRVRTLLRFWLPFRITTYKRMAFWSWHIGPLEATGHKLIPASANSSIFCFDMPWWAFFYLPICQIALVRISNIALDRTA